MFSKKEKWICCPRCGSKTKVKIYEDTVLIRFPLYCSRCKCETRIDAAKLHILQSEEPDG